jgi:phosphoribosylamine-glycine ligase
MNVLIIDQDGVGLSFALRAVMAGHAIKWFVKPRPSNSKNIGKGFKNIEKVDNWVPHMAWADLVFTTSNDDYLPKLDFFRKKGFPIFAPTVESANLEVSRKDGMKMLEKAGIEVAPYQTFKSMADAEKHVWKTEERYVFKTLGDNEDKSLTYVSKSPADLIAWMRRTPPPKGEVMLQTFIKGIELGVSRFMGKNGWVGQWNESFEHKKLMSGNFGPNTGEMGTVAYFTPESKIGEETLGKLGDELMKLGHIGDTALGFMIDEKGKPWPTEWTCRLGWPIANMMLGSIKGDPVAWMKDAVEGKDTTSFSEEIGVCVVLAHADFPHGNADADQVEGVPIYGVTKGNQRHIHPQAVQMMKLPDMADGKIVEKPMWATAGDYVAVVTGFGKNIEQARKRAYRTADQLHVANPIIRDDIGEKMKEQLPKLHEMGYATHCNYD